MFLTIYICTINLLLLLDNTTGMTHLKVTQVSQRPQITWQILMSVVLALTIQSPLFSVEIYRRNSQMFISPAGDLDMEHHNKFAFITLVCIDCC